MYERKILQVNIKVNTQNKNQIQREITHHLGTKGWIIVIILDNCQFMQLNFNFFQPKLDARNNIRNRLEN